MGYLIFPPWFRVILIFALGFQTQLPFYKDRNDIYVIAAACDNASPNMTNDICYYLDSFIESLSVYDLKHA